MNAFKKTVAIAVMMVVSFSVFAFGPGNLPTVPNGWALKETYTNVRIYQKGTEESYVQVIDVLYGGRIDMVQPGQQYGSWGSYPKFSRYSLDTMWNNVSNTAVSIVNGQFFNSGVNPTYLSFGIRDDWSILTYGQDKTYNVTLPLKQLDFIPNFGVIIQQPSTDASLNSAYGSHSIVGLDRKEDRSSGYKVGRMYLCAPIPASPSKYLLIMNLRASTEANANSLLDSWGCYDSRTVMMDGSGSSQLRTRGGTQMYGTSNPWTGSADKRTLPEVIAVYNY